MGVLGLVDELQTERNSLETVQLPQEVHPLLCFLGEGADAQFPLEVLGEDSAQEVEGLHSVDWGVAHGDGAE